MSDDCFGDIDWKDLALAGALSEEIAEEEMKRRRDEEHGDDQGDNSCCQEDYDPTHME